MLQMSSAEQEAVFAYPTVVPNVTYQDPKAALAWLERAFGFETRMLIEGPDGDDSMIHGEMAFGDGVVFVGGQWADHTRSPRSLYGKCTQSLHVRIDERVDAH